MSTTEDFEKAPVGATATDADGNRAMKMKESEQSWVTPWGFYLNDVDMGDFTLDPPAPTTAREALDLAWNLAHEVKEGQVIPKGARCLEVIGSALRAYTSMHDTTISPERAPNFRTLDPLPDPEPEPDWLDAPAVLARFDGWDHDEREVFTPTGAPNRWTRAGTDWTFHWNELRDVTPLYPKEEKGEWVTL